MTLFCVFVLYSFILTPLVSAAAQNEPIFEDAVAPALPELTAEQRAAAKRAFPDLYQFLDQLDDTHRTVDTGEAPNESLRQKAEEDSARKSRVFARYLDDDDESEEQWDDSVQFDKSLSETQEPQRTPITDLGFISRT